MTTKQHISLIKENLLDSVNSILEVQCGDGYDIENCTTLQNSELSYIGVDVRDEVIQDNRQYFRDEKNKIFMILDASNEPLPKSDLVVCDGMAPYLPIANIWSLLENIRDSEAKYFAFDYYMGEKGINSDIKVEEGSKGKKPKPKKRGINLSLAPFYFPKPQLLFPHDDDSHCVALYEVEKVKYFMDWHNDDVSKLRSDLSKVLDKEISLIEKAFADKAQYKAMMVDFLNLTPDEHNQKYYFDEPYKSVIDSAGVLVNRNNIFRLVHRTEIKSLTKDLEFVDDDNSLQAQILTKDYLRCKFGLSIWLD